MYIHKKTDLLKNSGSDFKKVLLYITWYVIQFISIHRKTDFGNSLVNDKKKKTHSPNFEKALFSFYI